MLLLHFILLISAILFKLLDAFFAPLFKKMWALTQSVSCALSDDQYHGV